MKKLIKIVAGLVLLVGGGWGVYQYSKPKNVISYITETVKRGKINQTVSAVGELSSAHWVDVGAQASGQIKKMHVKLGQKVAKGDLIAEIDNTTQMNTLNSNKAKLETFQAQLESAKIALTTAQKKYDRFKILKNNDAVSKEEFEATEDTLASAKAKIKELESSIRQTKIAINTAESDLGYTRIVSPISGTVVALMAEEGQTVNANQSTPNIVQLADLETMLNKMQIAEGDATKVHAGQNISFTILSEPDTHMKGVLDSVDPGLTTMSKGSYSKSTDSTDNAVYYYARALIPNPEGKLAIGMTTQNDIEINSADNVLLVPAITVKQQGDKKIVRILTADNKARPREVQTGLKDSMNIEIKSGLKEGEKVIISEMSDDEKGDDDMRRGGPPM